MFIQVEFFFLKFRYAIKLFAYGHRELADASQYNTFHKYHIASSNVISEIATNTGAYSLKLNF